MSAVIVAGQRRTRSSTLLSTAVLVSLTTVATYGLQRLRAAVEPAIVVLAAVTIYARAGRVGDTRRTTT